MGRTRRVQPAPTGNSLVASAVRLESGIKDLVKYSRSGRGWQKLAWNFYDTVGEYRYACDWVGSMLSQATLHATQTVDNKIVPVSDGLAYTYVDQLFGDNDGKTDMLRNIGIHLTVAGECYIVGADKRDKTQEWMVVAATELSFRNDKWYVDREEIESVGDPLILRLWRPHPQKRLEATSPSRSVLAILDEISKLTAHVSAQVDSRLAGAGILAMPAEMQFPPAPTTGTPVDGATTVAVDSVASGFMQTLQAAMSTAIENREDASALVPIVITAPGDQIGNIRHLTFWSELDAHAIDLRKEAIRRLALGMDMPPEVLEGVSDTNHWAAWQADESAIKAHTEPLLKIITHSLAEGYLRPLLDGDIPPEQLRLYSIGADTSRMRLRPNRSKEALELYDRGELDGAALRRETGFDEADAQDPTEQNLWFLRKVASGSTTPELVEAALRALGVQLGAVVKEPPPSEREPTEARPRPSLEEHPVREIPERVDAALVSACEQIVFRALERAGNRMKNRMGGKVAGVSAAEQYLVFSPKVGDLDHYLEDAFGQNVANLAERHNILPEELIKALDAYCRGTLTTQTRVSYGHLERFLDLSLNGVRA